jgi:hypothetical protein
MSTRPLTGTLTPSPLPFKARGSALLPILLLASSFAFAKPLLVDDFNDDKPVNMLEGGTGAWGDPSDPTQGCVATLDAKTRLGNDGASLRLDYDVESSRKNVRIPTNVSIQNPAQIAEDVYNGYFTVLGGGTDLRAYKHLVFSVKGDAEKGFTRSFKIELKGQSFASGVVVDGVTDKWQRISVPLHRFKEVPDWSRVKELVVVFGPSLVTRKQGTIYIDDVYFAADAREKLRFPGRSLEALRPRAPLAVDGSLQDWPEGAFVSMEDFEEFAEAGAVSGKDDAAAWFAAAWDDRYLYIGVDVQDREVVNAELPANIWKGDCVEVYIDPTAEELIWGDVRHFQLGFSPTSASGAPEAYAFFQKSVPDEDEVRRSIKSYKDGYQLELAVAWDFLGVEPEAGGRLGFSVAVHDQDTRDATKDAKLNWSFEPREAGRARLGKLVLK